MSEWISVNDSLPRQSQVVLTQHIDDLYPVCAFLSNNFWLREIEGPEDLYQSESGRYGFLLREPTHWMPLPKPPKEKR